MTTPGKITVLFKSGRTVELEPEEFHPYEPSAYCHDPGWTAYSPLGNEFFVSLSGEVWKQPENIIVGICPEFQTQAQKDEHNLRIDEIDYEVAIRLSSKHFKARKTHCCGICGGAIWPGQGYFRNVYKMPGETAVYTEKRHDGVSCPSMQDEQFHLSSQGDLTER